MTVPDAAPGRDEPAPDGILEPAPSVAPDLFALQELGAVFETSTVGIVVTNPGGRILRVNSTYAAMLGWTPEAMVGRAFTEWSHPDDRDLQDELRHGIVTGRTSGYRIDKRYLGRDGREVWGQLSSSGIRGADGRLAYIVGMVVDVTARHDLESERDRRLREQLAIWNGAPVGLAWFDDAARLVAANPAAAEMLALPEHAVGLSLASLMGRSERNDFREAWETFLARGTFDHEGTFKGPTGTRRLVLSLRARVDAGHHLATISDVTAIRDLQAQLAEAQKMESIGRFAGGVAHDMNNVLTAISGFVELAIPAVSPVARRDLEEALWAAQRAREMIRQLLAFSRRSVLEPEALDLRDALRSLIPVLRRLIGEAVVVRLEAPEPGWSVVDRTQFEQVLMNLAANARDAMPGGGELRIGLDAVEVAAGEPSAGIAPGAWNVVTVVDSGTGMDAATLAHVFEPFFTTKAKGKGTGLGLSTVYGIVAASGGQVTVSSEPGRGTRFSIFFPRISERAGVVATEQLVLPRMGQGRALRILLVEDEDQVRNLTERILSDAGDEVLVARDSEEAVRLGRDPTVGFDLIVTDVVMPGMSGHEVVREIRSVRPRVPALFVSGYDPEAIGAGRRLPARTAFLPKPFTRADLLNAVDQLAAGRTPRRRR